MNRMYIAAMIAVVTAVTIVTRFLPFWVLGRRKTPAAVEYLGRVLPYAIMAMLVVYCLKDTEVMAAPHGLPEAVAVLVTAELHVWKRSTLLSILAGTLCYMFLVQMIV